MITLMDNNTTNSPDPINPTTNATQSPQPLSAPTVTEPSVISGTPASPDPAPQGHKSKLGLVLSLIVLLLLIGVGGFLAGKKSVPAPKVVTAPKVAVAALSIPVDATEISKCAVGRGAQYATPKDIPLGPVYNVWQGKVIGIEFMVGKDALINQNLSYLNLPLKNQKYDHVNIGLLSQGHAGFPEPHYHVDVMMVPKSVTDQITCKA